MGKAINAILNLKDRFSKPVQNATKSTKQLERQTKKLTNSIKKMGKSMFTATKNAVKWGVVGATAFGTAFIKDSIDKAKEQIEQETKLYAVLANTKGMTKAQIDMLKNYAGELQKVGVIGDEVAIAGLQQLGSYQLQSETLKKLMPGMNDLIAQQKGLNATSGDAVNIGNMIGKVMTGQVGALKRAGINFDAAQEKVLKFGTEQEKASVLAQVLKQNVGGVNKALAQTDQGRIKQVQNAFGDMQEEIGKYVLPILADVAMFIMDNIPLIKSYFDSAFTFLGNLYTKISPAFVYLKSTLSSIAGFILVVINKLKAWSPVLLPLIGAIILYNTAMAVAKGITIAVTTAQALYNAVLLASPIMWVVGIIALLIAGFTYLYNNCETVRNAVNNFWNGLKKLCPALELVETLVKNLIDGFKWLADKVQGALSWITNWNNTDVQSKDVDVNINKNISSNTSASTTKGHALGTRYFQGGITPISEGNRSETAILPSGTRILSHNDSEKFGNNSKGISVVVNVQGNVIGNNEYMEQVGNYVGKKVLVALSNS